VATLPFRSRFIWRNLCLASTILPWPVRRLLTAPAAWGSSLNPLKSRREILSVRIVSVAGRLLDARTTAHLALPVRDAQLVHPLFGHHAKAFQKIALQLALTGLDPGRQSGDAIIGLSSWSFPILNSIQSAAHTLAKGSLKRALSDSLARCCGTGQEGSQSGNRLNASQLSRLGTCPPCFSFALEWTLSSWREDSPICRPMGQASFEARAWWFRWLSVRWLESDGMARP